MRTDIRTKQVTQTYKVYVAKDGKEFDSENECKNYEMMLDGTRIVCPDCQGKGRWKTDYVPEHDHWEGKMGGYWKYNTCSRCKGKGYLEKKVTWE